MLGEIERESCRKDRERVVGEIKRDIESERGSESDSDRKDRER